jgi:hypothetical protein
MRTGFASQADRAASDVDSCSQWIFLINVPIGVLAFVFERIWVRENTGIGIGRDGPCSSRLVARAAGL